MELIKLLNDSLSISTKSMLEVFSNFFSFGKRKTYFVFISIDNYEQYNLNHTTSFVQELKWAIDKEYPNFNKELIHLSDAFATQNNIYKTLIKCEKDIRQHDNVIFYFSGLSAYSPSKKRYLIPHGAHDFQGYISEEDLFSSIKNIRSENILMTFDWLDINITDKSLQANSNSLSGVGYKPIPTLWNQDYELTKFDKFSWKLAELISLKPSYYHRDTFLFLKHAQHYYKHFDEGHKLIESYTGNEQIKITVLESWVKKRKYKKVLESLLLTFKENDSVYDSLLDLREKQLNPYEVNLIDKSKNEIRILQNNIESELYKFIQIVKEIGVTVVLVPNTNNNETMKKKKILVSTANPQDTTWLRLDKEIRKIEEEINKAGFRDSFEIIKLTATRLSDLQDALLRHSPNFVHFSGHGCKDGICLVDENDLSNVILSEPLAKLFGLFSEDIECVFLNSCYSESQSEVIRKSIPKVIGMKDSVDDNTAIEFAAAFYKAIASNRSVEFSFQFAINSIDINKLEGSDIPILLS